MSNAWREYQPSEYLDWVEQKVRSRLRQGRAEHGPTFQGDPADHLEEELLDALTYHWFVKRKQEAEVDFLKDENAMLRKMLLDEKAHYHRVVEELEATEQDNMELRAMVENKDILLEELYDIVEGNKD